MKDLTKKGDRFDHGAAPARFGSTCSPRRSKGSFDAHHPRVQLTPSARNATAGLAVLPAEPKMAPRLTRPIRAKSSQVKASQRQAQTGTPTKLRKAISAG